MSGIMDIGKTGILANEYALMLTSQNISSAGARGYARRSLDFIANENYGGVSVANVRRISDETTNAWSRNTQSIFSATDQLANQLANLEPVFENDKTGIGPAITDSLAALVKANSDVSSASNRSLYLAALSGLSQKIQSTSLNVANELQNVNQSLKNNVTQINSILQSLATVNSNLTRTSGTGSDTLALQDTRDSLLDELSTYTNISTSIDSNTGVVNVNLPNGFQLVDGTSSATLATMSNPEDQSNLILGVVNNDGSVSALNSNLIQGGKIKGLLDYRNNVLKPVTRLLDRLSVSFASALNTQNKLGLDGNGNIGLNIFNDINSASAMAQRATPSLNNTGIGDLSVSVDTVNQLTASDYRLTIGTAGQYTLTRDSDGTVVGTGTLSGTYPQQISADGFSININSGTYNSGDAYTISPVKGGADNLNLISTNASSLAFAWPVQASVGALATGSTGQISVTGMTDTTTTAFNTSGQLNPPITIHFLSSTSYELVNATTSAVMEGPITYDPSTGSNVFPTPGGYDPGYRIKVSGTLQTGDLLNVNFNADYIGDNRNGQAMANLYKAGVLSNNTTFVDDMTNTVSTIAVAANQANSALDAAKAANKSAFDVRDSISGVNLEEENMNLIQYQAAYQASAQILAAAKNIMQIILQISQR